MNIANDLSLRFSSDERDIATNNSLGSMAYVSQNSQNITQPQSFIRFEDIEDLHKLNGIYISNYLKKVLMQKILLNS